MFRSILTLLTVGLVGLAATGVVFSLLIPLLAVALKVLLFVGIAYLILRLVKPEMADNMRRKFKGDSA
jgi:hypothetical protein